MASTLTYQYAVIYAGISLQVVGFAADHGRDVARFRPARGDGAQLSDRGQRERVEDLTVQLTGTAAEIEAARATLVQLARSGEARVYQHPLDGPYRARLTEFGETLGNGEVAYRMTLVEDRNFELRRDAQADSEVATIEDVRAAADVYEAEVAALAEEDAALAAALPAADESVVTAEAWAGESPDPAELERQVAPVRSSLEGGQERLEEAKTVQAHRTAVALFGLRATIERFRETTIRQAPRVLAVTVTSPGPLRQLVLSFYGPSAATAFESVRALNSITDPLHLAVGSIVRLPQL
jgi:hypothetical protein